MVGLLIALTVVFLALVGYMIYGSSPPDTFASELPPTEAELYQARLDIAKVEHGVDLALSKQELRRASERTKEAIAEALEDER